MASAIELYREAYDLDYRKGDWETAEEIYRKIVTKYPNSEEKEYALVHLERIEKLKADPDDKELRPSRSASGGGNALGVLNFFLILLMILGMAGTGYFIHLQQKALKYSELLFEGQLKEKTGELNTAAALYKEACQVNPSKSIGFQFLAELYLAAGKTDMAHGAWRIWQQTHPYDDALTSFKFRLQKKEKSGGAK